MMKARRVVNNNQGKTGLGDATGDAPPVATQLTAGAAYPLGANWDGRGINFALVAPNASGVVLCLFDHEGQHELARLAMPRCEHGVWHGYLDGAGPGQVYGYRVSGEYAPQQGKRFNPCKLLLDPYARLVVGRYAGQAEFCGAAAGDNGQPDTLDNAAMALKARVPEPHYDWGEDTQPQVPVADTVLYELHVKGYTTLHPQVPPALRGSYAGLGHAAVLDYLQQLGVTSVSLMPVHSRADEARLLQGDLSNYWGYSSIGFFAPENRYWSGRPGTTPLSEFRDMVKALHARGLEVLLDVVYNHTAETDEFGPTLSFRGIDNALYYCLQAEDPARYENWTGCGNCMNLAEPRVLQMVMDSLRYWVGEMHVDGFRFDLAPVLARGANGFSSTASFFAALHQDPALARTKLIAEPWDIGQGGYRLGQFPSGWLEWNDRFRDTTRAFWLHRQSSLGELARRFCGSSDIFQHSHRTPAASVNFITAHDGFTLTDLVSYDHKHNAANGEDNRDGHYHNLSWNCGVEGPSDCDQVSALRGRLQRALLATLFFSQGTPMLLAGDEIGHSQRGNNNAYCQDNRLTWFNWAHADLALSHYVQRLIALRRRYFSGSHTDWYSGASSSGAEPDIAWLSSGGSAMQDSGWDHASGHRIGIQMGGQRAGEACLLLLNAENGEVDFMLPDGRWQLMLDSAEPATILHEIQGQIRLPGRCLWLAVLLKDGLAACRT